MIFRSDNRTPEQIRPVNIIPDFISTAEGSALIEMGNTRVICTASVEEKVPPHKRGSGEGWVTAEYGMLPRATHTRSDREAARGKQSGRTQEIQRLIGRSMRAVFDLKALEQGIPDAAYKPLSGDDKEAARIAGRINREQREAATQHDLAIAQGAAHFASAARAVTGMPEDDLAGVRARARAYEAAHAERGWWATKTACDLYVAAFLTPKYFRSGALARQ